MPIWVLWGVSNVTRKEYTKKRPVDLRLYCYLCGSTLTQRFYLMTMRDDTDRVFLCCDTESCREQPEDGTHMVRVDKSFTKV